MKIIFTDFDGTIFNGRREVSKEDIHSLGNLRTRGITTVIATGRSIYSAKQEIDDDFPVDFLIFSSGAGIINWQTKKIIYQQHLDFEDVQRSLSLFREKNLDFMVHKAIPNNHRFFYEQRNNNNLDFLKRIKIYSEFAEELVDDSQINQTCQILAVIPPHKENLFHQIDKGFSHVKVIRATSPLDHKSIWMEIFPLHVDKGLTAQWLCQELRINQSDTVALGNDFNDVDLLNWAAQSYVVEEAPEPLKLIYQVIGSNLESPLTKVVERY